MEKEVVDEEINEDEENESVNITAYRSNKNFRNDRGKQMTKEERNELKEKEKERKERLKRVTERMQNRPMVVVNESSFFLACYDPFNKEIFFLDFVNETTIRKEVNIEEHEIIEEIPKRIQNYGKMWEGIIELSQLGSEEFLSPSFYSFFKRPFPSGMLFPESLGLNNFNSTYPLPMCFSNYEINLIITFHSTVLQDDKKVIPLKDLVINRKVGFYYVVDTIIKDSIRVLLSRLRQLMGQDEEEEEVNNNNINVNNTTDNTAKPYTALFNRVSKNLKSGKYKFVLKLKSYEEYLYGDNPICTYESIRTLVREFEPVSLFLMMYERERVVPSITHYPPLLYQPEGTETDFYDLCKRFFENFPDNCIIFSPISDDKDKELFLKPRQLRRREQLTKYCESGECDYPFYFSVNSISNLFAIKYHTNSHSYNNKEVILPYFSQIESKEALKSKKNILEKVAEKVMKVCKKKNKTENNEQEEKKEEEKHHKNQLKNIMTKYPENLSLHNELNYLKIQKHKKKGETTIMMRMYNSLKSNIPEFKIHNLQKLSSNLKDYSNIQVCYHRNLYQPPEHERTETEEKYCEIPSSEYEDEIKSPLFEETLLIKDYQLPHKIAPVFLKLEIMLYYGCYEIYKMESRFMIVNNNVNVMEKFFIPGLIFSHLPKEVRLSINLQAYDKLKNLFNSI